VLTIQIDLERDAIQTEGHTFRRGRPVQVVDQLLDHFQRHARSLRDTCRQSETAARPRFRQVAHAPAHHLSGPTTDAA
jgi:hypothetical protein